jgi:hypothetical protein
MKNDGREGYGRIQWLGGLITVSSELGKMLRAM